MAFATGSVYAFGNLDESTATQRGTAAKSGAGLVGVTITRVAGYSGSTAISYSDRARLVTVLDQVLTHVAEHPTQGISLDVVDIADNVDSERIEYLEGTGEIRLISGGDQTMLIDTAHGLALALDGLG